MAYRLAPDTFTQIMTTTGVPAAGCTLESYIFNTSTPSAMYTDSSGTSLGTSCTLNSRGAPQTGGGTEVSIFLDTTVTAGYKFILKDSGGATVRTYSGPIFPVLNSTDAGSSTFAADLADSTDLDKGSALVGHYDPIAPAYIKTTSDMLNMEPISLLRFLDKADRDVFISGNRINTNDLGPRIQIALDELDDSGTAGGGTLVFPRGVVMTGQELQIGHKTYVRGAGDGMTDSEIRLRSGSTVRSVLTNKYYPGAQEFCGVQNLFVNGNKSAATVTEANILFNSLFVGSYCRNVLSNNTTGDAMKITHGGSAGGTEGAGSPGGGPIELNNLWLATCDGYPLLIESDMSRASGAFCSFLLLNITTENTAQDACIKLVGDYLSRVMIINQHIETQVAGTAGVMIDGCPNVLIDGITNIGANSTGKALVRITNNALNVNIQARGFHLVNPAQYIVDDQKNGIQLLGSAPESQRYHYMTPDCSLRTGTVVSDASTITTMSGQSVALSRYAIFDEYSSLGNVAANKAAIQAIDNGAGKTQLVAWFPSGAVQVIATEP